MRTHWHLDRFHISWWGKWTPTQVWAWSQQHKPWWQATCQVNDDIHGVRALHQSAIPICPVSLCKHFRWIAFWSLLGSSLPSGKMWLQSKFHYFLLFLHWLFHINNNNAGIGSNLWWSISQQATGKVAHFQNGAAQGTKCVCHWWKRPVVFFRTHHIYWKQPEIAGHQKIAICGYYSIIIKANTKTLCSFLKFSLLRNGKHFLEPCSIFVPSRCWQRYWSFPCAKPEDRTHQPHCVFKNASWLSCPGDMKL